MEDWKDGRLAMRKGATVGQDLRAARKQGSRHVTRLRENAALQVKNGHQNFDRGPSIPSNLPILSTSAPSRV